jgi:hypothetical protein
MLLSPSFESHVHRSSTWPVIGASPLIAGDSASVDHLMNTSA